MFASSQPPAIFQAFLTYFPSMLHVWAGGLFVAILAYVMSPWYKGDRRLALGFLLLIALGAGFRYRLPCGMDPTSLFLGLAIFGITLVTLRGEFVERLLPAMKVPFWFVAMAIMGSLLVFGVEYRGGLYLPGKLNPTELAKPLLAASLAGWLVNHIEDFKRTQFGLPWPTLLGAIGLSIIWGGPIIMGVLVRDLGLVLLLCMTLVIVLCAATRRYGWLVAGIGLATVAGWGVQLFSITARTRFAMWQDPFVDPTGKGWQIIQSLNALYAGGVTGVGLGQGHPQFIPIVESDFIYSIWAEEFGLLGCIVLLALYAVVVARGMNAGRSSKIRHLLAAGLSATLAVQVLLNIAGVIKALPMTGITLPFISHGGTSLVSMCLTAGVLCACSVNVETKEKSPKKTNNKHKT